MKILVDHEAENVIIEENVTQVVEVSNAIFPEGISLAEIEAEGDLLRGLAEESIGRLPIGSDGQVLTVDVGVSGKLKYATPSSSLDKSIFQARLTLTTNTPITTSDVTGATTLYLTPFRGDQLALYYGGSWAAYTLSEVSTSLAGKTASTPYDVFVYTDDGSTIKLELVAWTNATTRATALTTQDGIDVKSGDATKRYAGSIYVNATGGQTDDAATKRYVWNMYNRVPRELSCKDTTNSWTYATTAWRAANANTTLGVGRVGIMIGKNEDLVEANNYCVAATGVYAAVGIGVDSVSVNSAQLVNGLPTGVASILNAVYKGYSGIGFHYIQRLETRTQGSETVTFYGDYGDPYFIYGMTVTIKA